MSSSKVQQQAITAYVIHQINMQVDCWINFHAVDVFYTDSRILRVSIKTQILVHDDE